MPNDKSHRNNSLSKEFSKTFWSEVKKNKFYNVFYTLLVQR